MFGSKCITTQFDGKTAKMNGKNLAILFIVSSFFHIQENLQLHDAILHYMPMKNWEQLPFWEILRLNLILFIHWLWILSLITLIYQTRSMHGCYCWWNCTLFDVAYHMMSNYSSVTSKSELIETIWTWLTINFEMG